MSPALRVALIVTVVTFDSVEVSAEGQVPRMKFWGPAFIGLAVRRC